MNPTHHLVLMPGQTALQRLLQHWTGEHGQIRCRLLEHGGPFVVVAVPVDSAEGTLLIPASAVLLVAAEPADTQLGFGLPAASGRSAPNTGG